MNNLMTFTVEETTQEEIRNLMRITGKPKETVLREVVEVGLKNYQTTPSKSVKATLDLIAWAEKEHITSETKDLSTNHNKYAWEE